MIATENKIEAFISSFNQEKNALWNTFSELRKPFVNRILTQDFPTTRNEYWKYLRTTKIANNTFYIDKSNSPYTLLTNKTTIDAYVIVLFNGVIDTKASVFPINDSFTIRSFDQVKPEEVEPYFAKEQDDERNIFNTLNAAYFTSGLFIEIHKVVDKPIHIIHQVSGSNILAQPRKIVVSKPFAEATILESMESKNGKDILLNTVNEFFISENSHLSYIAIQNEDKGVFNVNNTQAHQEKNSSFTCHHYTLNGDWVRNNTNILVNGENCESNLYGAYLAKDKQTIDNHTVVDHRVPNCISNELYKGTANDKSTVIFNGKVFVRKDAQKINAFQSNNNILLSDDATINSKPELEIYADDVKCSHGSTTGQLDDIAMFYLRSRGLSEASANNLLVGAFVGEVIEHIKNDNIKDYVKGLFGLE